MAPRDGDSSDEFSEVKSDGDQSIFASLATSTPACSTNQPDERPAKRSRGQRKKDKKRAKPAEVEDVKASVVDV